MTFLVIIDQYDFFYMIYELDSIYRHINYSSRSYGHMNVKKHLDEIFFLEQMDGLWWMLSSFLGRNFLSCAHCRAMSLVTLTQYILQYISDRVLMFVCMRMFVNIELNLEMDILMIRFSKSQFSNTKTKCSIPCIFQFVFFPQISRFVSKIV